MARTGSYLLKRIIGSLVYFTEYEFRPISVQLTIHRHGQPCVQRIEWQVRHRKTDGPFTVDESVSLNENHAHVS